LTVPKARKSKREKVPAAGARRKPSDIVQPPRNTHDAPLESFEANADNRNLETERRGARREPPDGPINPDKVERE
jgi:hypothetical protein